MLTLSQLTTAACANLRSTFHVEASLVAAAPGRVNLIGEHVDYCDGFVLPFAIDRYVVIAAAKNGTNEARIATSHSPEVAKFRVDEVQVEGEPTWANYLRGVVQGFLRRGYEVSGFDAFILSSVPGGAGLSSSAALECAMATLLEGVVGVELTKLEKALLCQKAEHEFAHVPCGIMDQYASTFGEEGHLILIDCQNSQPKLVPFRDPNLSVIIANTMVHHQLSDGGYAARRKSTEDSLEILQANSWRDVTMEMVEAGREKLGDVNYRRSRHVVGEIGRTLAAAAVIESGNYEGLGALMADSHQSLRDDFEVSCKELDLMVEIAVGIGREGGVLGARMTGGGFGGSTVTLCETKNVEAIMERMQREYLEKTGLTAQIFSSRPSKGAHLVEI